MKTINSLLIVATLVTLFSCSKQENFSNSKSLNEKLFNSDNINAMLQSKTISELKQEQQLLTANERQEFWGTKFSYILNHDRLTDDQRNIVMQVKSLLDSVGMEMLIQNDSIGSQFLERNLKYFSSHFTNKQLYILLEIPYYCSDFSIFNADEYINQLELGLLATGTQSCTCRYDLSCWNGVGDYCNTTQFQCTEVKQCGLLGTSACNGRCNQDISNGLPGN